MEMLVAVVGGGLQGVEAVYLAQKAGWQVVLVDRRPAAPASGLVERFVQADVRDASALTAALAGVDWILPALENRAALEGLAAWSRRREVPLAFDSAAYAVSVSKSATNRLLAQLQCPMPDRWPGCGFPVVAKPDGGSGSRGVWLLTDERELHRHLRECHGDWVLQAFVPGLSYSLEVTGTRGGHRAHQVTDLRMDDRYDCKRVIAPTDLTPSQVQAFAQFALRIADTLALKGIMDVEIIAHDGLIRVLEIDARLPSQTPTVVYWSSGENLLEALKNTFYDNEPPKAVRAATARGVVYEHLRVAGERLVVSGEHAVAAAGPLRLVPGFCGADEVLTDYAPGREKWTATLIAAAHSREAAWRKRCDVVAEMRSRFGLRTYHEPAAPGRPSGELP
jgi:pyrrolysine biosynthesis protein PylC